MPAMRKPSVPQLLLAAALFAVSSAAAGTLPYQQTPVAVQTADYIPDGCMKGAGYTVAEQAYNDGFANAYTVTGPGGNRTIEGTLDLLNYIAEQQALQKIEKISKTDEFKDAFKKAGLGPYETAKGLVTEPVDTVKKIGTGIGRWFSDVGHAIITNDPNQPGVAKTALGQAAAKRAFAYRLNVNPYTTNKELQDALDELAWVSFAGGLTVKAAFAAIPDTAGTVVSLSSTSDSARRRVCDKSPAELHSGNKKALLSMGTTPQTVEEFLNNYAFDPYEKTLLVNALESMKAVKNRSVFIANIIGVTDPSVARFMRLQAECMAAYAARAASEASLVDISGKTFLKDGGTIIGVFPFDHVAFTENLDRKEQVISNGIKKMRDIHGKKLVVYGTIEPAARQMLESRGWAVAQEKPALL